jgi:hypothetical protein
MNWNQAAKLELNQTSQTSKDCQLSKEFAKDAYSHYPYLSIEKIFQLALENCNGNKNKWHFY